MTETKEAMTLRELAFVRDVLIPRSWVQGGEVDELVRLRTKLDRIFKSLSKTAVPAPAAAAPEPPPESA